MMIHFWENTFWPKTSLFIVFRVPNSVYPEVFRCDDHSGTSFKAVWWSVSEKAHFGLKHHFSLYLEGQTQWLWGFQVWWSQWYKFQSCMMIHFWENTFWPKTSLSFVFRVPNSVYPEVFRCDDHSGTSFKAVWWTASEKKNTFWVNISLFFVFRGPILVHSEVFRSDDHSGTSFKAVWWSISEKNTFWLKYHFSLYLEDQT